MRAVVVVEPGGVDKLDLRELPAPELPPRCVRIEARAAALNRADLLQRRGLYPPPPGASEVLGLECAGVVTEVGSDARGISPGDRVMALLAGGGYAEQVVVPARHTLPIPPSMTYEQAAAVPEAFLTAAEALFTLGQLRERQTVLVHAAAGGVGSAATQLGKLVGARVLATAGRQEKIELASQLGADIAIDYHAEDFAERCLAETEGRGADVIVDFIGKPYAQRHQKCIARGGRWVVVGVMGGGKVELDFGRLLARRTSVLGLVMRTRDEEEKGQLVERFRSQFLGAFEHGSLRPVIDRVYPLSEVQAAHARMEANDNLGKIVLKIAG